MIQEDVFAYEDRILFFPILTRQSPTHPPRR